MPDIEEFEKIRALASRIGYQVNSLNKAREEELDQWEACVSWARSGCIGPRPPVPERIVKPHTTMWRRVDNGRLGKR